MAFQDLVGLLRGAGWSVVTGFGPRKGTSEVRAGRVEDWSAAASAAACAAAGTGVLAWVQDARLRLALFEDLRHIGDVRLLDHRGVRAATGQETLELLRLYGSGLSLAEAARRLHMSERTARRRVGAMRRLLGVRSNEQAVARLLGGRASGKGRVSTGS